MNNQELYKQKIKEFVEKLDVGDSFTYNELIAYSGSTEWCEGNNEYHAFNHAFRRSDEFKKVTKTCIGNHAARTETKYMKTSR